MKNQKTGTTNKIDKIKTKKYCKQTATSFNEQLSKLIKRANNCTVRQRIKLSRTCLNTRHGSKMTLSITVLPFTEIDITSVTYVSLACMNP